MPYTYVGTELDLFAQARNWKTYVRGRVAPHLGARVLEVGAGHGGTTAFLCDGSSTRWLCLEPDPALASRLAGLIDQGELPDCCQPRVGTLDDLEDHETFDTILYMDVLEHIQADRDELARAADHMAPGGRLVVLAPAHQWLFTPFDQAVGHFRRYTTRTLRAVGPNSLELAWLGYLDSVGMAASLANRLWLNQAMPTARQIAFWDGLLVPWSRLVDPCLAHRVGKSALAVWQRPAKVS